MTGQGVSFLSVVPRVDDPDAATRAAMDLIGWSDEFDLDGVLAFTGSGSLLDPWLVAAAVVAASRRLVPVIALNPLYTHPFAAARSLLTITELYGRRVDLNLITGAALGELRAVADTLDHSGRYDRLREHTEIFTALLDGEPVTHQGSHYRTSGLRLPKPVSHHLRPHLYLAGDSEDAKATAEAVGATRMGMLTPAPRGGREAYGAVHFGVIARPNADEAEAVAHHHFPEDRIGREMFRLTEVNTDSTWKRNLSAHGDRTTDRAYRLDPFRSLRADGPYLVGGYTDVVSRIVDVAAGGVRTFVLDAPAGRENWGHIAEVVAAAREELARPA